MDATLPKLIEKYLENPQLIAGRVRKMILNRGLSHTSIAKRLGLSRGGFSRVLTEGTRMAPYLDAICSALSCTVAELVGPEDKWQAVASKATTLIDLSPGGALICCGNQWVLAAGMAMEAQPGDRVAMVIDEHWRQCLVSRDTTGSYLVFSDMENGKVWVFTDAEAPTFRVILGDVSNLRKV